MGGTWRAVFLMLPVVIAVSTSFASNAALCGCNLLMEDHWCSFITIVLNSLSVSFTKIEGTVDTLTKVV